MGVVSSKNKSTANVAIGKALKEAQRTDRKTKKILLLGPGDSGKSTVFRQLQHTKGRLMTAGEIQQAKRGLINNIVRGMESLITGTEDFGEIIEEEDLVNATVFVHEALIMEPGKPDLNINFDEPLAKAIIKLWNSPQIQAVYRRCSQNGKYAIPDSYPIIMEKLDAGYPEWGGPKWVPTPADCLLRRKPTVGISSSTFKENKTLFRVIDAGGQRCERKKWLPLFEGVHGLIYVCSMSDYDQTLYEASAVNRLQESIKVFKSIAHNPAFASSAFMIFFNKYDIFQKKYLEEKVPINMSGLFETAPSAEDDADCRKAKKWFANKFVGAVTEVNQVFYVHYTCALDEGLMKNVIEKVEARVVRVVLTTMGLAREFGAQIVYDE